MTRRRAQSGMQVIPRNLLSIKGRQGVKIISVFHFNPLSALLPYTGRDSTLHPNYAYNNGSIDGSTLLGSIVQASSTVGLAKNLIVKKVKQTFYVQNVDSIAKEINIVPIPWNNTGASGLGNDYGINLKSRENCKTFLLAKSGIAGDTIEFSVVYDCAQIEGIDIRNQPLYWATGTARGSQYSNYYFQTWALDNTSTCTNGINCQAKVEYDCDIVQHNTNLNA